MMVFGVWMWACVCLCVCLSVNWQFGLLETECRKHRTVSNKIALHRQNADSINVKFEMDATWTKTRLLQKTLKRDSVSFKLNLIVQKKPSVRFKFLFFFWIPSIILRNNPHIHFFIIGSLNFSFFSLWFCLIPSHYCTHFRLLFVAVVFFFCVAPSVGSISNKHTDC